MSGEGQREAGAAGQVADQAEGERKPSAHLLSDGQDVGHSGRVSHQAPLPVPGNEVPVIRSKRHDCVCVQKRFWFYELNSLL